MPGLTLFTFDTDWTPPFMLEDTLTLLGHQPATFFITDQEAATFFKREDHLEVGIHPNFMPGSTHGGNRRAVMEHMLELVPRARSVRAHNLLQDTTVLDLYKEYGLRYECSLLEYQNPQPRPFRHWNGLLRMPFNYEDDIACMRHEVAETPLWISAVQPLIANFHPVHIYLNTDTMERYAAVRALNRDSWRPSTLKSFVNRDGYGIRNVFADMLAFTKTSGAMTLTVSEYMETVTVEPWAVDRETILSTHHAPGRADT